MQASKLTHGSSCADGAILKQAIEHGTVVANVNCRPGTLSMLHNGRVLNELTLEALFGISIDIVGCDTVEEIHVFVGVKLRHFSLRGRFCTLFQ